MFQSHCFRLQRDNDIWSHVLVEAMSAGLPCISSINSDAIYDLMKDRVTGFAIDFLETDEVVDKVNWILENPRLSKEIGQNASRFIAENVNIKKSAAGFVKAITEVLIS